MKITTTRTEAFKPVTLNITFETQEELTAFQALSSMPATITQTVQVGRPTVDCCKLKDILTEIYKKI